MTEKTTDDVYEAVLDVREKVVTLGESFGELKTHVNDELSLMNQRIDGKLDNDELLTSLGFKLLNNRFIRWTAGVVATTVLGTVVVREWLGPFWLGLIQKLLGY